MSSKTLVMIMINGYQGQSMEHTLVHLAYCLNGAEYRGHSATHLQLGGLRMGSEVYARYESTPESMAHVLSLAKLVFKDKMPDIVFPSYIDEVMLKRYSLKIIGRAIALRIERLDVPMSELLEKAVVLFESERL